jgi:DNA-binding CsgD family transcriptional regulator
MPAPRLSGRDLERLRLLSPRLTGREFERLQLLMDGLSVREIAETLVVAHRTAQYYNDCLRRKFGVKNRRELIPLGRRFLDELEGR